jgi:hypothetical protein
MTKAESFTGKVINIFYELKTRREDENSNN